MSKPKTPENIVIRGARLVFPNFSGKPTKYSSTGGKRTVGVVIEDLDLANRLEKDGWRVKYFKPNLDTGEIDAAYIVAKISYVGKPPKIIMITNGKQTPLDADSVGMLDWADIVDVKVEISPYPYDETVNGTPGISAYVKTMYATIQEDVFAADFEEDFEEDDGREW